jgi:hypothetical protein
VAVVDDVAALTHLGVALLDRAIERVEHHDTALAQVVEGSVGLVADDSPLAQGKPRDVGVVEPAAVDGGPVRVVGNRAGAPHGNHHVRGQHALVAQSAQEPAFASSILGVVGDAGQGVHAVAQARGLGTAWSERGRGNERQRHRTGQ